LNIYFSCSITGGRQDQHHYDHLVQMMLASGHEVPTAILASQNVMDLEVVVAPEDVFRRDIAWIDGCDVVVAEVSTPSHGVGYEIAYALGLGKPVLCCYQAGRKVSKMITGNNTPGLSLLCYHTLQEAEEGVSEYLDRISKENEISNR
jgi:nucleoside 2-deoxyribosyltransferase